MQPGTFNITEHVVDAQHIREYPSATADNQEDILSLHVRQYTPIDKSKSTPNAVTIIGAHANGFPKVNSTLRFHTLLNSYRSYMSHCGKRSANALASTDFPYGVYGLQMWHTKAKVGCRLSSKNVVCQLRTYLLTGLTKRSWETIVCIVIAGCKGANYDQRPGLTIRETYFT